MKTQTDDRADERRRDSLAAAGMTLADVVSSRVFITDTALFQDMNAVYRTAFPANPPARATVKVGLTAPQYLVEITMLAVKGGARDVVTTPNADGTPGQPNPVLSSAIKVGPRLFLSGMLGVDGREQGRRGRADARDAGEAGADAEGCRLRLERRGGGGRLPAERQGLRRR